MAAEGSTTDRGLIRVFKVHAPALVAGCYVAETEEENHWVLSNLWVTPNARGNGYGSQALSQALQWADEHDYRLLLEVGQYGDNAPLDDWTLTQWYKRNGFRWDREWELFARSPQSSKPSHAAPHFLRLAGKLCNRQEVTTNAT